MITATNPDATRDIESDARHGRRCCSLLLAGARCWSPTGARAATPRRRRSRRPRTPSTALVPAVKAHDRAATPRGARQRGPVRFRSGRRGGRSRGRASDFVAAYDAKHAIARDGDTAKLTIGNDDFPFAFPLVKSGDRWRFDTAAGKDELLARRIGANELVRDQGAAGDRRRAARVRVRGPQRRRRARVRAQDSRAAPGKRDGLYWPTKAGEPPSPLGALVAQAAGEGYRARQGQDPRPITATIYRMLKGQGKNADGRRARLRRARPRDRRLRRRRVSGQVRQLRHHDVHRQPGRQGVPGRSRDRARPAKAARDAAIRSGHGLVAGGPVKRRISITRQRSLTSCTSTLHPSRLAIAVAARLGAAVRADRRRWSRHGARQGRRSRETVKVTATITAIDKATRDVTLKGPQGNEMTRHGRPRRQELRPAEGRRPGRRASTSRR